MKSSLCPRRRKRTSLETEIEAFLEQHSKIVAEEGLRQIVRSSCLPAHKFLTDAEMLLVEQPRAKNRPEIQRVRNSDSARRPPTFVAPRISTS